MAGNKLSPRQKMIGMMYLVLTALLAMNVSKEILNAFITVNEGLEKTKANFKGKNADQYAAFQASYGENPNKVGPFWEKAQQVRSLSDEIVSYVDKIKVEIIHGVQPEYSKEDIIGPNSLGHDTVLDIRHIQVKDNYLVPTNILVGSEPANPKTGEYTALELQSKLENFRDKLISILDNPDGAISRALKETFYFGEQINPASRKPENWPAYNFYGVPTAATLTLLTKIQTDVRNAESDVVKFLYADVDAASFKFNKLEAAVISPSNYVIIGDTFRAEVFLAAFDSTQNPVIQIADKVDTVDGKLQVVGDTLPIKIEQGKGYLNIPARSVGDYNYAGVVKIKNPATKEYNPYKFTFDYKVASPSTTISATKMNVFYIGVDNPVDISAAGVARDQINASITNGSIVKKGSEWIVRVTKPGKATVNVSAKLEVDGEMTTKRMGAMDFRVKRIPTPIAEVAGKTGGAIGKGQLGAQLGIIAKMENFEFDVRVVVSSYEFSYVQSNGLTKDIKVDGPSFTETIKGVIRQLKPGSRVTFDNIKVKMPDGEIRRLSPVVLKLV
jgi:gliding motility-associated protein GldM